VSADIYQAITIAFQANGNRFYSISEEISEGKIKMLQELKQELHSSYSKSATDSRIS